MGALRTWAIPLGLRRVSVVIAAVAILGLGTGGALAASNPPTLYACYDVSGNVRIADVNTCKLPAGGRLVPINAAGIAGPTGPAGPGGSTGSTGATGATGSTGSGLKAWAYVKADRTILSGSGIDVVTAFGSAYCLVVPGYVANEPVIVSAVASFGAPANQVVRLDQDCYTFGQPGPMVQTYGPGGVLEPHDFTVMIP
jgi:hypothetical protein